jgi:EAL domain-containing protein (putative c-di-GMP-specific phosphodiesterase class I)
MDTSTSNLLEVVSGGTETRSSRAFIDKILHAVRLHLGMDVAFVSRFRNNERVFTHVDSVSSGPLKQGDVMPLEDGYCSRITRGELPELMADTSMISGAQALPETANVPIGAHIGVPICLENGRLYGTFCCFSYKPDLTLSERDLEIVRVFAELIADKIDSELTLTDKLDEKEARIRRIIEANQPIVFYQPIYSLDDMRITGWESLSRFRCEPVRSPDVWFQEAAEVGLGKVLELCAIRTALKGLTSLPANTYVSFNCSAETMLDGELIHLLDPVPLDRVVLEITEHDVVADYEAIVKALAPLRKRGMRLAIDDAGAGYSSLQHILELDPDLIKLDMSLVREIDKDSRRRALASALIAFARETNTFIVAEGVETPEELAALRALGADKGQGNLLSRAVNLEEACQLPGRSSQGGLTFR